MYNNSFFDTVKGQKVADAIISISKSLGTIAENKASKNDQVFESGVLIPREEYNIYKKVELNFRIEDAKRHILDFAGIDDIDELCEDFNHKIILKYGSDIYESLALEFLDNQDCNVAENDTWNNTIIEYFTRIGWKTSEPLV